MNSTVLPFARPVNFYLLPKIRETAAANIEGAVRSEEDAIHFWNERRRVLAVQARNQMAHSEFELASWMISNLQQEVCLRQSTARLIIGRWLSIRIGEVANDHVVTI